MNYHEIINHLFLGNTSTHEFFHTIVNCTHEIPFSNLCDIRIRIPINDDIDDCGKLIQLLLQTNVIHKMHSCILSGQNVLVHCSSYQRSFAVIACYLLMYYGYTPIQAVNYIFEKSSLESVRFKFMNAVIAYYYICKRNKKIKN